ncbi:MAG: hypothetical protein KGH94_02430 [Candidatus Micrarchaeota archaeon]|nr:hypothetical protein [Candidatus Micrarchaeota archaeon]
MPSRKTKDERLSGKEPVFIIKPVAKGHGLDYLHLALAVLVVVLIGFAFALAYSKPAQISTCNSISCGNPQHNESQVLSAANHALVYYSSLNTSLSLLPYYSKVNQSTAFYVPSGKYWLVVIPYVNPFNGLITYNFSMTVYDSNLSIKNAFINSIVPAKIQGKSVVGFGTISVDNTAVCNTTGPMPVYLITDPYAPGAFAAIRTLINASSAYGSRIDSKYFMVFSKYAISKYQGFGLQQTQLLGNYMYCASKQPNFKQFMSNLSIAYTGQPLDNLTLGDVARGSSLDMENLASCLSNSSTAINYQADLASNYNITSTPQLIVNCKYLTIPQTLYYAINYSLKGTR